MADPVAILSPCHVELIEHVLKACPAPTTLVICATRELFLQELQADIHKRHQTVLPGSQETNSSAAPHSLLIPTIHLLATAKTVHIAFAPTIQHLRAYLATFQSVAESDRDLPQHQSLHVRGSTLMLLGLVALHRSTSENSAQGLSRSLATAVEAAKLTKRKLVLVEARRDDVNEDNAIENETMSGRQQSPWEEQIPLLNGSIRFGNQENTWAGRTIDVGRVVGRWCKFEAWTSDDHE